jgi:lipid-A-disaccharide synthase
LGYSENQFNDSLFDYVMYQSRQNNLMVANLDAASVRKNGLCVLPGSRPEHLDVALPLMLKIVDGIPIPITVILSPFTPDNIVEDLNKRYSNYEFLRLSAVNELKHFKFALTIPGTNTMQLAYLNIPFLMILPTHKSKILRLDGLIGLLLAVPIFGSLLKFISLRVLERLDRLYALPNKLLNTMLCPELVGRFTVEDAQAELKALINDSFRYTEILDAFKMLKQSGNVADYFADWIIRNR